MTLLPLLAGVLVLAGAQAQQPPPADAPSPPGRLRWVIGVVTTVSSDSLTVRLRDETKTLRLALDPATDLLRTGAQAVPAALVTGATALPAVGSVVEVHYTDKDGMRRAALIVDEGAGAPARLSKRPGASYRGAATRIRAGKISLRVDNRTRQLETDVRTWLVDADGSLLASGSKPIADVLSVGDDVLVKYESDSDTVPVGDLMLDFSSQRATGIRRLRRAAGEGPSDAG